jgi:cation-transporting ATPase E
MTGDGVNDVLALKDADMGIAMGSGSAASRAVAQLVLLDNRFATLPVALAQGRRVINNIERVANLFLTKTSYAVTLALLVGLVGRPFPFLPRQLTLVDAFSIGVPGVVLALAPSSDPVRPGLLRRVLSFAIPAGIITGSAAFLLYDALLGRSGNTVDEARTGATATLLGVSLVVLVLASRPLAAWKVGLALGMLGCYVLVAAIDPLREFFRIDPPDDAGSRWLVVTAIAVGGMLVVAAKLIADRVEARRGAAVADDTSNDPTSTGADLPSW